jgi:pyruvate dehydrogenase kinase 2/3/4
LLALNGLLDRIRTLAQLKERPVALRQLLELARDPSPSRLLTSARFLHQELPVRIAHRFRDLEALPRGLAATDPVRQLREMYIQSLGELTALPPPADARDEEDFTRLIDRIKHRHGKVVVLLGQAILELRQTDGHEAEQPAIQEVLDRFLTARIGMRMLIGQHVAVHGSRGAGEELGLLSERCSPAAIAAGAAAYARRLCAMHHGAAPQAFVCGDPRFTFAYAPSHLHHMVLELLKNALRAVVERYGAAKMPAVRIVVAEGTEDVTIKVSDEGGGIPRSGMGRIWTYFYTTAPAPPASLAPAGAELVPPFTGIGFGLPLTRLHARYFGGDLEVISMEGFGTDACLHLRRLDAGEVLPRKR